MVRGVNVNVRVGVMVRGVNVKVRVVVMVRGVNVKVSGSDGEMCECEV